MTTPLSTYGGGYYSSPSFPDTPIYDNLVAERGAPQIAPIRVPSSSYEVGSSLPALPALPALPSASSSHTPQHGTYTGYTPTPQHDTYTGYTPAQQHSSYPAYPAPAAYIPPQASAPHGYTGGSPQQTPHAPQVPQTPYQGGPTGYNTPRPVPPRPAPPQPTAPGPYGGDQYRRPNGARG
jgi:Family of unknown function (DUF6643)